MVNGTFKRNNNTCVIIETRSLTNDKEMVAVNDVKRKALFQLVTYYLTLSRKLDNNNKLVKIDNDVHRFIACNGKKFFIFDENCIIKVAEGVEKDYQKFKLKQFEKNTTDIMYDKVKEYLDKKRTLSETTNVPVEDYKFEYKENFGLRQSQVSEDFLMQNQGRLFL